MNNDPKKINLTLKDKQILQQLSGQKIYLRNTFGQNQAEIHKLLEQGRMNAQIYLDRHRQGQMLNLFEEQNLHNSLAEIQTKLKLKNFPRHIECYDISHFAGKHVYGAMVTFIDGRPARHLYRLFKTAQKNDDCANLREVLTRRLTRWLQTWQSQTAPRPSAHTRPQTIVPWQLPDLMIIDGGKGQLSSALSVLTSFRQQYPIIHTELCALAKAEEEVFLPNRPESFRFEGQAKFLLQRIRDEAHRFGLTHQQRAMIKSSINSSISQIPGIGPITTQKLLTTFGSVAKMLETYYTSPQTLQAVVNKKQFAAIQRWIETGKIPS